MSASLAQRIKHKFGISAPSELSKAIQEYQVQKQAFDKKVEELGISEAKKLYWYHTIDLGDGLITPGSYDYRSSLHLFQFPEDMRGMEVLDIGSATGFFAFEFEKRGADVTSLELPSTMDWDMPSEEDRELTLNELMREFNVGTTEEVDHYHLHGPFDFCAKKLNSKVKRLYSSVYDLHKATNEKFDMVFAGDILLHTFSPLMALSRIADRCKGALIVSQELPEDNDKPMMYYLGGESRSDDSRSWWYPNRLCFEQMLKRVGFSRVELVGYHSGFDRAIGYGFKRAIFHASKA